MIDVAVADSLCILRQFAFLHQCGKSTARVSELPLASFRLLRTARPLTKHFDQPGGCGLGSLLDEAPEQLLCRLRQGAKQLEQPTVFSAKLLFYGAALEVPVLRDSARVSCPAVRLRRLQRKRSCHVFAL